MDHQKSAEPNNSDATPETWHGITSRLRALTGQTSVNAFALKCEIPESSMRKYLTGSMPGADKLVQIARANGVTVQWLATGEGFMRVDDTPGSDHEAGEGFERVPSYKIRAGAGVEQAPDIGHLAFSHEWMRQKGLSAKDMVVVRVAGDSMSPTIRDGALVLVDTRQEIPKEDGIYILSIDDHLVAKRLQVDLASGGLYVKNDNATYREQCLTPEQASSLLIVGKAVWAGGEI